MNRCSKCVSVHRFIPREDEIARGLMMGCRKPGWEGYTHDDNPACGGVFFASMEGFTNMMKRCNIELPKEGEG